MMSTALYTTLKGRMSPARLLAYERETGGDPQATLALYEWNILVSGAFFEDLGAYEVLLRNAIDSIMRRKYQGTKTALPWYRQVQLQEPSKANLEEAERRITPTGGPEDQDKVVAELTFGFWRYLFSTYYTATVWPILQNAFHDAKGDRLRRTDLDRQVGHLYDLRNRIAHHEPIFYWDLASSWEKLVEAAGWICSDTRDWISARSRMPTILAARPGSSN